MKLNFVGLLSKTLFVTRVNKVNVDKKENQDIRELVSEDLKWAYFDF